MAVVFTIDQHQNAPVNPYGHTLPSVETSPYTPVNGNDLNQDSFVGATYYAQSPGGPITWG